MMDKVIIRDPHEIGKFDPILLAAIPFIKKIVEILPERDDIKCDFSEPQDMTFTFTVVKNKDGSIDVTNTCLTFGILKEK